MMMMRMMHRSMIFTLGIVTCTYCMVLSGCVTMNIHNIKLPQGIAQIAEKKRVEMSII